MSEDCHLNHASYSEESYFYKETQRLIADLRRMATAMIDAVEPAARPALVPVLVEAKPRAAA